MYYVPDGTEQCGYYECKECGSRFLDLKIAPTLVCPYCGEEADMEIGPDEEMPKVVESAKLIQMVRGVEEVEKMDKLLSLAVTGGDFSWIVGKCADYVLKNRPNVVSIYIEAPRAFCVERTIANMGVTPEVANATIERTDKFRVDYYKYYTHGNYWTNPVNYDLTLNSERVGVENCVKTIEQYLIIKGFIKADMIKPVGELI